MSFLGNLTKTQKNILLILQWLVGITLLCISGYYFLILENFWNISLNLNYFLPFIIITPIIFFIITIGRKLITRLVVLVAFLIFVGGVVIFNRRTYPEYAAFLKKFYTIKKDMTFDQVEDIMQGYSKGSNMPTLKTTEKGGIPVYNQEKEATMSYEEFKIEGVEIYRATNIPGDLSWGEVYFKDGKVIKTNYSPD